MASEGLTVLEICAGGGGQSRGLELAGFAHTAAIEVDPSACATLRLNRPTWRVLEQDVRGVDGGVYSGVDLLAGGVPCPPFSVAGKQLGGNDERDLFPDALRLVREAKPRAVMLENVPGLASAKFAEYRQGVLRQLRASGYACGWKILNACQFGVPQRRQRLFIVALRPEFVSAFAWPTPGSESVTMGEALRDLMGERGWPGADDWAKRAAVPSPTLVGGSKKHGGADLGPRGARRRWATLGVDGRSIADDAPGPDYPAGANPRLTLRMAARLQGFEDDWRFAGPKTAVYRQIGNALPPPVARAVGQALRVALSGARAGA